VPDVVETASWPRRALALFVDWAASTLVVIALGGLEWYSTSRVSGVAVLATYVVESGLLTALAKGSFGQLLTGLRVVRFNGDPRPLNLLAALARSILIALVIPPLVFRPDGRGLHDLAVGSVTVPVQRDRRS
jgi:uncharacterized RDD family membrane protein YckC